MRVTDDRRNKRSDHRLGFYPMRSQLLPGVGRQLTSWFDILARTAHLIFVHNQLPTLNKSPPEDYLPTASFSVTQIRGFAKKQGFRRTSNISRG